MEFISTEFEEDRPCVTTEAFPRDIVQAFSHDKVSRPTIASLILSLEREEIRSRRRLRSAEERLTVLSDNKTGSEVASLHLWEPAIATLR
jgi:hypothetical protein